MPQLRLLIFLVLAHAVTAVACSGGEEGGSASAGSGGRAGSRAADAGSGAPNDRPELAGSGAAGASEAGMGGSQSSCAKKTAKAMLDPVYLVFAFDVSGSMGKGDKPWHDRTLKWDPVVRATRAFLEDASSGGLSASMTFFPADGGEDARCEVASYQQADVSMRELPSQEFGKALDAIGEEDWRGGTPTLYVMQGVLEQIAEAQKTKPGRYEIVLVTDGYPQDCDEDSIEVVAELVKKHAADTRTYVIGVTNPPIDDAPDVTTNLADIAEAGGTDHAYLIDTGNPDKTVSDFRYTIESIRGAAIACNLGIPEPPAGQSFDKTKVSVKYLSGSQTRALTYAADCAATIGWHYDDADQPREIVLCPQTCETVQADGAAELNVDFECEQVILGPL